jgi:hypothetical protein
MEHINLQNKQGKQTIVSIITSKVAEINIVIWQKTPKAKGQPPLQFIGIIA